MFHAVCGDLPLEPLGQLRHPRLQPNLRLPAQQLTRERHVGEAMADVAGAEPAGHLRLDVHIQSRRELLSDLEHGDAAAGADAGTEPVTYTVATGDTLWEIATEQYSPAEDPRATIEAIRQENALEGYLIKPGMSLELPR